VNVHGCGIGWYARERCGLVDELGLDAYNRPTVYTTVAAPSHDRNLRALSKTISSSLLFGHVRAAGPGASVHQYNCHPFFKGRYMFMHNGDITDFSKVRRGLQHQLRDDLFDHMSGTTDSELLFLLILNRLPDCHTQQDPATLQQAVLDAFCAVIQANRGKANSLNIAFTDGETTIATRYRNSDVEEPPSLYYHVGPMPGESAWDLNNADLGSFDAMETDPNVHDHRGALTPARDATTRTGTYRNRNGMRGEKFVATQALLVSSEPLTGGKGLDRWELLPSNSMIVAAPTRPTVGRCTRAALVAKLKEIGTGGGRRHNLSESSAPVLEIEVKCIRSLCRDALGDECPETARGVSDARAEASASETPRFADSPRVASPTRRDDAGDFSGAFGSRDAPSGERSGGSGGSFVAASLPNKTFLHGPSMGVPFRSNSGGRLSNARRQSVDVSRMAEAPARAGGAGGAGGARPSALSATLGARARASDDREAVAPAGSTVSIATATLGSLGFGVEGGAGEGGGPGDWRVSARAEAATMSADGKRKTGGASGGANGAPPRRNSSFTEGSSRDVGGWTSYNPATGPR
jgi:predicted glutamine amidotransferase